MQHMFDKFPHIEGEGIVMKKMSVADAEALKEMVDNKNVYRFLPTFVFELQHEDVKEAIRYSYTKAFFDREAILLGVYLKPDAFFCGIAEIYHFDAENHKVSLGYRLAEKYWRQGIATEIVRLITQYLFKNTDIETIGASHITENPASGKVLEKNGFKRIAVAVQEGCGYEHKRSVDKWCITKMK